MQVKHPSPFDHGVNINRPDSLIGNKPQCLDSTTDSLSI